VVVLQHSDSFDSNDPESPKKAAVAAAFDLPVILTVLLTFCHKRPNAKPGENGRRIWAGQG